MKAPTEPTPILAIHPRRLHVYPDRFFNTVCVSIEAAQHYESDKVQRIYVLPLDREAAVSMAESLTRAVEGLKEASEQEVTQ